MKRICHVVFEKYPLDDRVRRYCKILHDGGYDVFVVCSKGKGESSFEFADGVKIYRLPIQKLRKGFIRRIYEYALFEILSFVKITELFIKDKVYLYHIHTLPDFLVFSTIVPKLFGAKVILDFHELFPEFMIQQTDLKEKSLLISFVKFIEKISFRYADFLITFHDPCKEVLLKRNGQIKDIRVIMNAIDESESLEYKKCEYEKFRLVYHGTVNYNMNLVSVVKALKFIRNEDKELYEKIEFFIYGNGPALAEITEFAKEQKIYNVHTVDWLKYSDVVKELGFASAIVLPPKRDVYSELYYSLKLLDAVYYKIPVIASDLKTYKKYFPHKCLNYFSAGDDFSLANVIADVFSDYKKALERTETAYKYYKKVDWSVMRKRYNDLLKNIEN